MQIVFHVDMDAFFSAVEIRERPELKDKPVVVGADPKGGSGRGVVSTCNYNARKFGIRSGMPISKAYKLCPDAVFLPVNFELYWKASDKVMQILRKYAEKFQQAGIDEAYMVPKDVTNYAQAEKIANKIKIEIKEKEHLTCSIGIAPSKLVAKIASDYQKPDGLTIVKPEDVKKFLNPMEVRKLYGVGPKTESVLNVMGIKTIGDLAKQNPEKLGEVFGKWGYYMYEYANGKDDSEVEERGEPKSVGKEVTFEKDTDDINLLKNTLNEMSEEIYDAAKAAGFNFKTVVLKIRFENFETHTRQKSFKQQIVSKENVKRSTFDLLSYYSNSKKKVRLIGLRLTNLKKI